MNITNQEILSLSKSLLLMIIRRNEGGIVNFDKFAVSHNLNTSVRLSAVLVQDTRGNTVLYYEQGKEDSLVWNGDFNIFSDLWQEIVNYDEYLFGIEAVKSWNVRNVV